MDSTEPSGVQQSELVASSADELAVLLGVQMMPWQRDLIDLALSGEAFYFPMDGLSRAQRYGKQRVMDWLETAADMGLLGHIHVVNQGETICYGQTPACDLPRRTGGGIAGASSVRRFYDEVAHQ